MESPDQSVTRKELKEELDKLTIAISAQLIKLNARIIELEKEKERKTRVQWPD
jgi:hypothetical protein